MQQDGHMSKGQLAIARLFIRRSDRACDNLFGIFLLTCGYFIVSYFRMSSSEFGLIGVIISTCLVHDLVWVSRRRTSHRYVFCAHAASKSCSGTHCR